MKKLLILALTLATLSLHAADPAPKPFPKSITKCLISGDKLGGDMGKAYVFVQDGQEVKLCCKDCLKDFKKDPAKYMAQIKAASDKK